MRITLYLYISILFISTCFCAEGQDNDESIVSALEIYKKKNNKSYIVKIDDVVMIPCYIKKGKRKSLAVARLIEIKGAKIYFEPVNRHYRKTSYSKRSIKEIGVQTTWSLLRSAYFMACYIMKKDYWGTVYGTQHSFKMFNMKSKKYGIQIIETEV